MKGKLLLIQFFLIPALIIFLHCGKLEAGFSWKSIPSFPPNGRYGPTEFVIGNKAYVGFGIITGVIYQSDMWEYNQTTNIWTQKANIPTAGKFSPRAFAINGKGYVMTGWSPAQTDDLWEYDPILNSWTQKLNFPGGARYTGIGISINGKGYFGTGYAPLYSDWWQYDPVLNTWTQKANVPGSVRQSAIAFEINGLGYAGMGSSAPTFGVDFDDFYSYNPVSNIWTTLPNFPGGVRFGCEEFVLCDKGYVGLGLNSNGGTFNDFYKFDPVTGVWSYVGVFTGGYRNAGTGFSIGNKGYIGLGSNGSYLSDMWEYSIDPDSFSYSQAPCGSNVSFTAIPGNSTTYFWDFGDSNTSNVQNPSHSYATSGIFNVLLITTNECVIDTFAQQISVTASSIVQAAFSYAIDTCIKTISFTDNSLNPTSWSWNFGDSTFSSVQNPTHQYVSSGNHLVTLLVYNACDTDSVQININLPVIQSANAAFTLTVDTCTGIVTFNNQSTNSLSFIWHFGDGDSSIQSNPTHQYAQSGNYNVTLFAADICGGDTLVVPLTLTISPQPTPAFSLTLDSCTYQLNFTNQSLNSSAYLWQFGDNDSSSLVSPSHQYQDSGNYVVTLYSTNGCGMDSISQNIYIPGIPVADASFQYTLDTCLKTVSFNNLSNSSFSYFWSFSDGTTSSSVSPSHTFADSGSYQVILVASNSCNADSAIVIIYIPDVPVALSAFTYSLDTCTQTVTFNNMSNNGNSFLWNFGDGSNSITTDPIHPFNQPGIYQVNLIVNGVCNSDTSSIQINIPLSVAPVSLFNFVLDSCSLNVTFNNNSQNTQFSQWNFGDNNSDTSFNSFHLYADTGTYIVSLITTNFCGSDTLQIPLHIIHPPSPDADFSFFLDSCIGVLTLSNNSANANSYFWSFGNGDSSNLVSPSISYPDTGNYLITLISFGPCEIDSFQSIVYIPLPPPVIADFSLQIDTCSNTVTFTNQSVNGVSFQWYFMDGDSSIDSSPAHTYSLAGTYEVLLIATNSAGCSDSLSRSIELLNDTFGNIFIPNCFTPNNDGLNETFKIQTINNCIDYKLEVYNRWGQLIYSTSDLTKEWDGRFNSRDVPEGVYYYLFSGKNISKKGSISIFR